MTLNKTAVFLVTYVLCAFLTFGHVFNANYVEPKSDCGKEPNILDNRKAWDEWYWCENPRYSSTTFEIALPAFLAAMAWPIYWGGHFAIKVTK